MYILVLVLGLCALAIGAVAAGFGITIKEFSLGSSLLIAGTTTFVGGLVMIAVAGAIRELAKIARALTARPVPRYPRPGEPVDPNFPGAAVRPGMAPRPPVPQMPPFPPWRAPTAPAADERIEPSAIAPAAAAAMAVAAPAAAAAMAPSAAPPPPVASASPSERAERSALAEATSPGPTEDRPAPEMQPVAQATVERPEPEPEPEQKDASEPELQAALDLGPPAAQEPMVVEETDTFPLSPNETPESSETVTAEGDAKKATPATDMESVWDDQEETKVASRVEAEARLEARPIVDTADDFSADDAQVSDDVDRAEAAEVAEAAVEAAHAPELAEKDEVEDGAIAVERLGPVRRHPFDAIWPESSRPSRIEETSVDAGAVVREPVEEAEQVARDAESTVSEEPLQDTAAADAAQAASMDQAASMHDEPQAAAEEESPRAVAILKSGVVDGMAYTLYADGSIEAVLAGETIRFASINELRQHIEATT